MSTCIVNKRADESVQPTLQADTFTCVYLLRPPALLPTQDRPATTISMSTFTCTARMQLWQQQLQQLKAADQECMHA